jgi:CheY-like chemotaxis protein
MAEFKILVCDDEPHIVHVVSAKLRNNGFEVVSAADGEEAFDAAKQHAPDLVITDYQMPFLSGLELCAKLRADPQTAGIPVIMLTARGFSLGDEDLKDTNIRKVLLKPFSPREVLKSVSGVLEARLSGTST